MTPVETNVLFYYNKICSLTTSVVKCLKIFGKDRYFYFVIRENADNKYNLSV